MTTEAKQIVRRIFIFSLFGIAVCIFTLNGVLKLLATKIPNSQISQAVTQVAQFPDYIYNLLPGGPYFLFTLLVHWGVLSVFILFILLTITALRHGSPSFFIAGTAGFLAGLFIITELTLLILLGIVIFYIFTWLLWLFGIVITFLMSWLLWPPVLIVLGVIALIFTALIFGTDIIDWLKERLSSLPAMVLAASALVGLLALIWYLGIPAWNMYILPFLTAISNFLKIWLGPLLAWIFSIIGVLLIIIIAGAALIFVLSFLGQQYLTQYISGRFCGRSTYEAFDACFGIGASIALILLVCSSNPNYYELIKVAWSETSPLWTQMDIIGIVYGVVPQSTLKFLQSVLAWSAIPIFDATTLVLVLFLMNCSLLMGLFSGVVINPLKGLLTWERMPALIKLAGGAVVILLMNAIDSEASSNQ